MVGIGWKVEPCFCIQLYVDIGVRAAERSRAADVDQTTMWTAIIAVIAFCVGFFLAALLACAKSADAEMEEMRATLPFRNDLRREAMGGA